jgi:hypothetical protein
MKSFMALAAVLAVGLAVGGGFVWYAAPSRTDELAAARKANTELTDALADERDRSAQLEEEAALLRKQADRSAAAGQAPEESPDESLGSVEGLFENLAEAMAASPKSTDPPANPEPGATPTEEAKRRAQWEQRRREFAARIRERVGDFLQAEMDATGDPNVQDRLEAMGEYVDYYMELRVALRAAETEEEKEELRGTLADATQTMRELLTEQQDEILRDVLSEQGITAGQKQEEFIAALRQAQSSPFFRGPFPMGDYAQRGGGGQ